MTEHMHFTVESGDEALRRCALTLHAVPEGDRRWLLAKLPAEQAPELERLLGELKSLGITPDSSAANAALKYRAAADKSARAARRSAPVRPKTDAFDNASPADLARQLQHEPAGLIAHVLGMHGAAQSDAVLAQLNAPKRRQVQDLLPTNGRPFAGQASRLSEALRAELCSRLTPGRAAGAVRSRPRSALGQWQSGWSRLAGVFL